ncbi:MAG: hypothetical protein WC027_03105 [Candidatus Paceibacterota bacterium]
MHTAIVIILVVVLGGLMVIDATITLANKTIIKNQRKIIELLEEIKGKG